MKGRSLTPLFSLRVLGLPLFVSAANFEPFLGDHVMRFAIFVNVQDLNVYNILIAE